MIMETTIEDLLKPLQCPKTYGELLASGVPHKGGLAQLAAAESARELLLTVALPRSLSDGAL
jgi:hypothetical protein